MNSSKRNVSKDYEKVKKNLRRINAQYPNDSRIGFANEAVGKNIWLFENGWAVKWRHHRFLDLFTWNSEGELHHIAAGKPVDAEFLAWKILEDVSLGNIDFWQNYEKWREDTASEL